MGNIIRKKLVYSVGVSDDGEFAKKYRDGSGKQHNTKEYMLWCSMLQRCYSEKHLLKYPTYNGCSISENFKSFQYFANWCQSEVGFKVENYNLDKDLLLAGNKVYSEDTCVFIPRNINTFLVSRRACRGKFPVGVYLSYSRYYVAMIHEGTGKQRYIGTYSTPELAFAAYKTAKETKAKELAIQYEGLVDPRVIVALNNYVVNIDD